MADHKKTPIKAFVVFLGIPLGKLEEAVAFYKAAYGAEEVKKVEENVPVVESVEILIAGASILLCDLGELETKSNHDTGITFYVEVEDFGSAVEAAVIAGAVPCGGPVETKCENGTNVLVRVMDPFGYFWAIVFNTFATPPVAEA